MGGKSSKNNSWSTPQEPIQESPPKSMPDSEMYASSIPWQSPDSAQNDAPTYINEQQRNVTNGDAHVGNALYYNQSQGSLNPTNHISENSYANPVQITSERLSTPTNQGKKTPKKQEKKTPKSQEVKGKKDSSKSSTESPAVNIFPDVHIPRANFDREWYIGQLQEKKHLHESVYETYPESDEGRLNYSNEREEPNVNRTKDRSDSNPAVIYTSKEKASRPLIYQSATQHENASPVKTSRGNSQLGVDPYSSKNPSKESENSNPKPTALVQVLPSEPFEIRNLKRHQAPRGSPQNNKNYFPDPDYNENRNSYWDFENPSAEGRWMPDIDY